MSSNISREYRKDPHGVTDTVILGVKNLYALQTIVGGSVADNVVVDDKTLTVYSPEVPLFVREASHLSQGYGATHDFGSVLGFDERCSVDGLSHIELILRSLALRIKKLHEDTEVAPHLRQSYVYGAIDMPSETATGRLLLTHEIFPNIRRAVSMAKKYLIARGRCYSCDMLVEGRKFGNVPKLERGIFRAYSPFSPGDEYAVEIFPTQHITSIDDVPPGQMHDLATIVQDLAYDTHRKAREHREIDSIVFAVHSVPRNFNTAEAAAHMRVLMSVARKQDKEGPYTIPYAGVEVIKENK